MSDFQNTTFYLRKPTFFSFSQSLMLGVLLDPHKALYNNHRELLEQLYCNCMLFQNTALNLINIVTS